MILAKNRFRQINTSNFCNLAQEGPREKIDIAKCSQWPHLYTTYEATYDLKLTDNEIFAKNRSTKRCNFLRIFAEVQ